MGVLLVNQDQSFGVRVLALLLLSGFALGALPATGDVLTARADLVLHGGRVWTVDADLPEAEAVAIRGNTILAVGTNSEILALAGPQTEVINLRDRLVLPGFNDAHTHFGNAAAWLFNVSLYDVSSAGEVLERVRQTVKKVPAGLWITGGDFGAEQAWKAEAAGAPLPAMFAPTLEELDAITPHNPVVLRRWDGARLVNSLALARARWTKSMPDPRGGRIGRHPETGELNGLLFGRAGERMEELMPPRSREVALVGGRAALEDLRRAGITSIQDVARIEALSQRQTFHTHVERSSTELELFQELQKRGELTVRVYALLTLPLWEQIVDLGIRPGADDGRIRFGALKGFIDAYLMEEPFADTPGWGGSFTFRFADEKAMREDILGADRAGFDVAVHVTGDRAHRLLLDWYETAYRNNPPRDRRFRLIHAWYPTPAGVKRAGALGLVADVTPYHLIRSMSGLVRHVGPERAAQAHPWRSLIRAGAHINLVSDWPGSYNEQQSIPLRPLQNIYYAVTRSPRRGDKAWRPDQALTVQEAIRAYTSTPAWASHEQARKGTVTPGKLADLVVISQDILEIPAENIPDARVDLTILDGQIIYRREENSP